LRLAFDYYSDDATIFAERSIHASAGVGSDAGRRRWRLKENLVYVPAALSAACKGHALGFRKATFGG
jgi:hypothetical protein